jgi:predicted transcriptional regulator
MKNFLYSFAFIILFLPSVVFAGACPMLKSEIEGKISKLDETKHETLINIALMLHKEGVKAHDSGDHGMSEELLNGALRLLDI